MIIMILSLNLDLDKDLNQDLDEDLNSGFEIRILMKKSDKSNHNHNSESSKCEIRLNHIFDFSDLALDCGVIMLLFST